MKRFEYARPSTVEQAIELLGDSFEEAEPIAGGTDLLSLMKDFVVTPRRLVSLEDIEELRGVERVSDGSLAIGATTTIEDLLSDERVQRSVPALADAAAEIASAQIRAMGTVGGELLQRPRCWYFRRGFGLLAARDGRSLVVEGDHRHHAVFGNSGLAKFVSASRLAPPLLALSAEAEVAGPQGRRRVPVERLYRIPVAEGEREHTLAPNELLTRVFVPAAPAGQATVEIRHRTGLDWPEATASVVVELAGDGRVKAARAALGHVAPVPWPVAEVEGLVGRRVDEEAAASVAERAVSGATPLPGNVHKVALARAALRRAILAAARRAAASMGGER